MLHLNQLFSIDSLPSIDLHGYDRETARVATLDFIRDNYKQKINLFCIVHGRGSGTLKQAVHDVLRKDKRVIDYKTFYYNQGCTVVEINVERP